MSETQHLIPDKLSWIDKKKRGQCLLDAVKIINGDRQDRYGQPEDCFGLIAKYWGVYLGRTVTPEDVAMMMSLFKIARYAHKHDADSITDCAGYLGLCNDLAGDGRGKGGM